MRRLALIILILLVPALAPGPGWSQAADTSGRIRIVKKPPVVVAKPPPKKPAAPKSAIGPYAPLSLWAAGPPDTTQCRTRCAQDRYFCEAGGVADACAGAWGQCSAACGSPNLRPVTGVTP